MSPISAESPRHSPVNDQLVEHQDTKPVTAKGQVLSCSPPLAQRSISNESPGESEFDPDSVQFVREIAAKITYKQSLDFLKSELSDELRQHKWSVKFRHYTDSADFGKFSGYVLDDLMRLRISFGGSILPRPVNCFVTELSLKESKQLADPLDCDELHNHPQNKLPDSEALKSVHLFALVADFKRGQR